MKKNLILPTPSPSAFVRIYSMFLSQTSPWHSVWWSSRTPCLVCSCLGVTGEKNGLWLWLGSLQTGGLPWWNTRWERDCDGLSSASPVCWWSSRGRWPWSRSRSQPRSSSCRGWTGWPWWWEQCRSRAASVPRRRGSSPGCCRPEPGCCRAGTSELTPPGGGPARSYQTLFRPSFLQLRLRLRETPGSNWATKFPPFIQDSTLYSLLGAGSSPNVRSFRLNNLQNAILNSLSWTSLITTNCMLESYNDG